MSVKKIPENQNGISAIRHDAGFTLIENLIALLILTIGLLGMGVLAITIIQDNKASNQITTATALAQDKMEEIKGLRYEGLPATDSIETENYNSMAGYPRYKRVTVTDVDQPAAFMKTVSVTVYWDSDNHSVNIKMLFSR